MGLPDRLPIESVTVIGQRTIKAGFQGHWVSRPGHLLNLLVTGECIRTHNGRRYHSHAGDVNYLHNFEDVVWERTLADVTLMTVGFYAPQLQPPPIEQRHFRATAELKRTFAEAQGWSQKSHSRQKELMIWSCVFRLIANLPLELGRPGKLDDASLLWWQIETSLRQAGTWRTSIDELARRWRRSPATVARCCRRATGLSPLKRIAALRMEQARGLLLYSALNITQIASKLGYSRIHEFSREFSQHFKRPPSAMRNGEPIA